MTYVTSVSLPLFVVLAGLEIGLELMFQVLGPLFESTSTVALGAESALCVAEHPPEILQFAAELQRVVAVLLKLQAQLVQLRGRRLVHPRRVVAGRRRMTFSRRVAHR